MALALSGSVGDGGTNTPADVTAVQQRLVDLGFTWVAVDGAIGPQTIRTIRLFQAIINGHQRVAGNGVDGRVDVNGTTHRWLDAANAPGWQEMPPGSAADGYQNIEILDPQDDHDFGTNWLAETIAAAGVHYRTHHLNANPGDALLTVNDASRPEGGDTKDHAGHETGLSCDLRLPRTDGTAPGSTTFNHAAYDQAAMRAVLQAFQAQSPVSKILFNDPVLIAEGLCTHHSGHDDHVHVEIEPPARMP